MKEKKLPLPQFGVLPETDEEEHDPKAKRQRQLRELRASRIPTKPTSYTGRDVIVSGLTPSKDSRKRRKKPTPPKPKSKTETPRPEKPQPAAKTTDSDELGKL